MFINMHQLDTKIRYRDNKSDLAQVTQGNGKSHRRNEEPWLLFPCFSSSFKRKAAPVCKAPGEEMAAPGPFHNEVGRGLDCLQCLQTFCILLVASPGAKPQKPACDWELRNLGVSSLLLSFAVTSGSEGAAFQTSACIYLIMEMNADVLLGKNPSLSGILMG